jgi:hypothetical protein
MYEIILWRGSAIPGRLRVEGIHSIRKVEVHCYRGYLMVAVPD